MPNRRKRFHMDEDVGRAVAARDETEAAQAVEPFDRGRARSRRSAQPGHGCGPAASAPDGWRSIHPSTGCGRPACPSAARQPRRPPERPRTRPGKPSRRKHADMEKNVLPAIVRHDEAIALGDIEPFDRAGELDQPDRLVLDIVTVFSAESEPCLEFVRPHQRHPLNAHNGAAARISHRTRYHCRGIRKAPFRPSKRLQLRQA